MASIFLSYLLGIWLLLGQFPVETTTRSLSRPQLRDICTAGFTRVELKCKTNLQTGYREEVTLQEGSLSEIPVIFSQRDVEALKTLSEFNPEFPQDLKAALSDSWSVLRNLQHPKDRERFLRAFTNVCCRSHCAQRVKFLSCGKHKVYYLGM